MSDPFGDFAHQRKYLMGVARARGLSTMDAEDAVSSAVLSLYERYAGADFDVLRAAGPLAVRRKVMDDADKRRVEDEREARAAGAQLHNAAAPAESVMLALESEEAVAAVRCQVLEMVDERHRALDGALFDAVAMGLLYHERTEEYRRIAVLHGYAPQAMKSRVQKVRTRIRRVLLGNRRWQAV